MNTPQRIFVGFFEVPGFGPDSVEVPFTDNGRNDYAALDRAILHKHPSLLRAAAIARTGAIIELRDPAEDPGYINLDDGRTLRQLFDSPDGVAPARTSLRIGRVFFNSTPCNVMLTFTRAANSVGILLLPRVKMGDTVINFSNKISPQLLVSDLPRIVKDVLGHGARALDLNTRKGGAK